MLGGHLIHVVVGQVCTKLMQPFHGVAHGLLLLHIQPTLWEKWGQLVPLLPHTVEDGTGHEMVSQPVTG